MDINELLKYANDSGVSDLFVGANKLPAYRLNGVVLQGEDGEIISQEELDAFRIGILTEEEEERYQTKGSADAAFNFEMAVVPYGVCVAHRISRPCIIAESVPSHQSVAGEGRSCLSRHAHLRP